jgi:DNA polymerase elongation subunit (family B)
MTNNFQSTQSRRLVALDIETVSLTPTDPKGALDALAGRIVCIGLLFDDGENVTEQALIDQDERRILEQFWKLIQPTDVFVGHNVLGFDLPFILQRSWILRVQPSREVNLRKYYTTEVFDTMQVWTNWGSKGVKLDVLAGALGCGNKSGSGVSVSVWWSARDFQTITKYCLDDVRITYRVFRRLMYLPVDSGLGGVQAAPLGVPPTDGDVDHGEVA